MKVKNRIKRTAKALIAVYFAVIMCFMGCMTAFAWNVDTLRQSIELENPPDGTAFADILVKDKKNDKYAVDFNEENGKLLGVGKDCGLAKYEESGCTSMLLRHNCAVFERADTSGSLNVIFRLKEENNTLFNHFRRIKVAYCDKDGNILGVTDEAEFELIIFNTPAAYSIEANGSSLVCRVKTGPPYYMIVVVPLFVLVTVILLITVIIAIRVRRKTQTARMIKRIQSGEVDNERKEQ